MLSSDFKQARLVLVDDDPDSLVLLQRALEREGYTHVATTTSPEKALELCREFHPDLVMLDLAMPKLDGVGVLKLIREHIRGTFLPVIMITGVTNAATRHRCFLAGANDVIFKPFEPLELAARVASLLQIRLHHLHMEQETAILDNLVAERTRSLVRSHMEILERLAAAGELRDDDTGQHTFRVGTLSGRLAEKLGLPELRVGMILRTAPLHDIGKVGIPDSILLKPGRLEPGEWEIMKSHTTIGARLLAGGSQPLIQTAESIALSHHERWDGTGYPSGIHHEEIPIEARIVAVADVFDALTHDRPYKRAWPAHEAVELIRTGRGSQFDPLVVDAFLELIAEDTAEQDASSHSGPVDAPAEQIFLRLFPLMNGRSFQRAPQAAAVSRSGNGAHAPQLVLSDITPEAVDRFADSLRQVSARCLHVGEFARLLVSTLHQGLRCSDGTDASIMASCFITQSLDSLPPDLQALALQADPESEGETRCLVLAASEGGPGDWAASEQLRGYRVIPLHSRQQIEQIPMSYEILRQLGLEADCGPLPNASLITLRSFQVSLVEEALGSPFIRVQEFVRANGVRSVIGFGGTVGSEFFTVLLWLREKLSANVASHLESLAATIRLLFIAMNRS